MGRRYFYTFTSFYCPHCGKKAMDLPRPKSLTRNSFHRKKLYCPWCKDIYNCIECRDDYERKEFLENFENGVYKNDQVFNSSVC